MVAAHPLLSVILPIYNVGSYLAPCLDSLLDASLTDLEIICIDDGSTDGSGVVAENYASKDERIRVLHIPNGGLGNARNVGVTEATGRYLAFADSDDRIPRRAYELMCSSLGRSGSDFATGRARRFTDATSWSSGLHRTAIPAGARGTHITRHPSLVYDTTAWNKVFRRSFWDAQELSFPVGVFYEDIPVMIPAHVLAGSVDMITAEIYEWRDRGDASGSITQRRAELKNLQDRLSALEYVSEFLAKNSTPKVARAHDLKVLSLDMPLYVSAFDDAPAEYRQYLGAHMKQFMKHIPSEATRTLNPWDRVAYELLRRERLDELGELVRIRRSERSNFDVVRIATNTYAQLPYLRDRTVGVPDSVYEVTHTLAARAVVEQVSVSDDKLTVAGYSFVSRISSDHWWSALRYVRVLDRRTGKKLRWVVTPKRSPDATAEHGSARVGYDYAGFCAHIPLDKIRSLGTDAFLDVHLMYGSPWARRSIPVWLAPLSHLAVAAIDDDRQLVAYAGPENVLRIALHTRAPRAIHVEFIDDCAKIAVTVARPAGQMRIVLSAENPVQTIEADLVPDGNASSTYLARIPVASFAMQGEHDPQRVFRASLRSGEDEGRQTTLVVAAAFVDSQYRDPSGTREMVARIGAGGRLLLTDRRATITIAAAHWHGGELVVEIAAPAAERRVAYALTTSGRTAVEPTSVETTGTRSTLRFAIFTPGRDLSIAPVTWTLRASDLDDSSVGSLPLEVDRHMSPGLAHDVTDGLVRVRLIPERRALRVRVRSGRLAEAGVRNETRGYATTYRTALRRPLTDKILFQAWSGKQYSCNSRAIYEELRRREGPDGAIWVRHKTDVVTPEGVRSVLFGSREYYDLLATARCVVSNDSMPIEYVKRPDTRYLQTWHGTPLKRIAFDIENANFSNPRYLEQFATEVSKWDSLVSPNAYSSEIFRRAFDYNGTILETGYPRNDVFYGADAESRRDQIRARLGLFPNQRAVLWAPTWRDDQRDSAGRYRLALPFDMSAWDSLLQPDDVLLFRGHQLLLGTGGGLSGASDRIRNVTAYPDIQDLYLASDVLITDYSSVMFDFANTRRPMIFYAWDLENYRDNLRGFYVDYDKTVPGPLVTGSADLREVLADLDSATSATSHRYAEFLAKFCSLEDGQASARVVDAILC